MARGVTFTLGLKRRREGRTDYRRRSRYLVSGIPRIVVRESNAHYFAHVALPSDRGDITIVSAHSRELARDYGWKGHGSNATSGYLTGYLCGKRASKAGIEKAILDAGRRIPRAGTDIYAVVKGAIDGGLQIPCDEGCFPKMEKIKGQEVAKALEDDASVASYRKKGVDLASLPQQFDEIVAKIDNNSKEA